MIKVQSALDALESESMETSRDKVTAFRKPVKLHLIGKDSSNLVHLVRKRFDSGSIPVPIDAHRHHVEVQGNDLL